MSRMCGATHRRKSQPPAAEGQRARIRRLPARSAAECDAFWVAPFMRARRPVVRCAAAPDAASPLSNAASAADPDSSATKPEANQRRGGGFGGWSPCLRRGAGRDCSPYCRTIAAGGFSRTPPAPSTSANSAAGCAGAFERAAAREGALAVRRHPGAGGASRRFRLIRRAAARASALTEAVRGGPRIVEAVASLYR